MKTQEPTHNKNAAIGDNEPRPGNALYSHGFSGFFRFFPDFSGHFSKDA